MEDYLFGIRIFRALAIVKQKQAHTFASPSKPTHKPKLAKECNFANALNFQNE
jgi:hypothetical protein